MKMMWKWNWMNIFAGYSFIPDILITEWILCATKTNFFYFSFFFTHTHTLLLALFLNIDSMSTLIPYFIQSSICHMFFVVENKWLSMLSFERWIIALWSAKQINYKQKKMTITLNTFILFGLLCCGGNSVQGFSWKKNAKFLLIAYKFCYNLSSSSLKLVFIISP